MDASGIPAARAGRLAQRWPRYGGRLVPRLSPPRRPVARRPAGRAALVPRLPRDDLHWLRDTGLRQRGAELAQSTTVRDVEPRDRSEAFRRPANFRGAARAHGPLL